MTQRIESAYQINLEFEIQEARMQIIWRADILGRRVTSFTMPYSEADLPLVLRALEVAQHSDDSAEHDLSNPLPTFRLQEQEQLATLGLWQNGWIATDIDRRVGQAIYAALGSDGQHTLKEARNHSIFQGKPIRYVLRFPRNAEQIAALPWELLADHDQFVLLGRGHDIDSCERYLDFDRALPPPLPAGTKPHLLALLPSYDAHIATQHAERQEHIKHWERLCAAGLITFDQISPLTTRALTDYMQNAAQKPSIIHYFGRGIYTQGEGYLLFDDSKGGKQLVSAAQLAAILGNVRLVVLHASQSATVDPEACGLLTGVAPVLSLIGDAVVAMQLTVEAAAATRFSEIFYRELLLKANSLQNAVAAGRQALFVEARSGTGWYVPTLYIRSRETTPLFVIQQSNEHQQGNKAVKPTGTGATLPPVLPRTFPPLVAQADPLKLMLVQGSGGWVLRVENMGIHDVTGITIMLRPPGDIYISSTVISFPRIATRGHAVSKALQIKFPPHVTQTLAIPFTAGYCTTDTTTPEHIAGQFTSAH